MRMDLVQPQPSSNAVRKCEHIGHQLLCACLRFDDLAHPLTLRKTHGPLRGNPRLTVTQQVRWQAGRQQMGMGENEHPPKKQQGMCYCISFLRNLKMIANFVGPVVRQF